MIGLTLAEIAAAVDGAIELLPGETDERIVAGAVETDSREIVDGGIFVALRGETTDGHLFARAAVDAGATLLLVEHQVELAVTQIVVDDGVTALAALARHVVTRLRSDGPLRVIGVTGSNGKTTTKNLLAAVLSTAGPTVAPRGSFNNHVGAPLSMLRADESTRFLVVEMGASAPGDIAHLVGVAMPDISVVLKVGLAHAGGFGGIEATQRAKAEIVTGLPDTAIAVLNADDPRVAAMAAQTAARIVTFGLGDAADIRASDLNPTSSGTSFIVHVAGSDFPSRLRILGEHQVMNALAALTVAIQLGIDPGLALETMSTVARAERWRMELLRSESGVVVINDAYNASPDSTAAALKTLAQLSRAEGGRSFAVLGEMAELGDSARDEHDRIGRLVVRLNISQLVAVGSGARHIHTAAGLEGSWDGESILLDTADEAYALLSDRLRAGDIVLVKSSNSAGLRLLGDRLAGVGT